MIKLSEKDLKITKKILREIVPEYEVRVFGSRVTSKSKYYSDLDLAIFGNKKLTINKIADLKEAFQESDLSFRVDVVDWARLTDNFKKIIEKKYVVIQASRINLKQKNTPDILHPKS